MDSEKDMSQTNKVFDDIEKANKSILKLLNISFNENDKIYMFWYSEKGHAGETLVQLFDNYKTLCTLPSKTYNRLSHISKILK